MDRNLNRYLSKLVGKSLMNPPKKEVFTINSKHRTSSSTGSHNFNINVTDDFFKDKKRYHVISYMMPNTIYTVNDTNNKLYWTDSVPTNITSTIPNGFYDATTLSAAVATVLNADKKDANVYTATVATLTQKITIGSTGNMRLMFSTNTSNSIAYTLGYDNDDTAAATSHVADNVVRLDAVNTIFVRSKQLGGPYSGPDGKFNDVVCKIQNIASVGNYNILLKKNTETLQRRLGKFSKGLCDFYLTDGTGVAVNLNGADWNVSMMVV